MGVDVGPLPLLGAHIQRAISSDLTFFLVGFETRPAPCMNKAGSPGMGVHLEVTWLHPDSQPG